MYADSVFLKISLQFLHMVKQLQRFFYEGWKDLFEIG